MNFESAVQAIYHITTKKPKSLDRWTVLKLVFFADRYHLRKYGRTITDDNYYAMENGPVATTVYDIIKGVIEKNEKKYVEKYLKYLNNYQNITNTKQGLETDHLSETDKEALDFAVATFGHYKPKTLVAIAHNYPEWKKFEDIFKYNPRARINMDIQDFFENPSDSDLKSNAALDSDPFKVIQNDIIQCSKEIFLGNM